MGGERKLSLAELCVDSGLRLLEDEGILVHFSTHKAMDSTWVRIQLFFFFFLIKQLLCALNVMFTHITVCILCCI